MYDVDKDLLEIEKRKDIIKRKNRFLLIGLLGVFLSLLGPFTLSVMLFFLVRDFKKDQDKGYLEEGSFKALWGISALVTVLIAGWLLSLVDFSNDTGTTLGIVLTVSVMLNNAIAFGLLIAGSALHLFRIFTNAPPP